MYNIYMCINQAGKYTLPIIHQNLYIHIQKHVIRSIKFDII